MAVILCGGSGTRLWPLSRSHRPKQFTALLTEESLLKDTYRRLLRWVPAEHIFAVAGAGFTHYILEDLPELEGRIFVEPSRSDTGPAMYFAAKSLMETRADEPLVFIPSDHYIGDDEAFLKCLQQGEELIRTRNTFVDIGISPTFPSTALGYTRVGEQVAVQDGITQYAFAGHTEKPNYETAKAYLQDGRYLWHANYYMATPRLFVQACEQYAPEILRGEAVAFDRVVTERMPVESMVILRGTFPWSDVGTWDALHERLAPDGGNVIRGDAILSRVTGSLVYATSGRSVVVQDIDDVVVVDTEDAVLVMRRQSAAKIKDIVAQLKNERPELI